MVVWKRNRTGGREGRGWEAAVAGALPEATGGVRADPGLPWQPNAVRTERIRGNSLARRMAKHGFGGGKMPGMVISNGWSENGIREKGGAWILLIELKDLG